MILSHSNLGSVHLFARALGSCKRTDTNALCTAPMRSVHGPRSRRSAVCAEARNESGAFDLLRFLLAESQSLAAESGHPTCITTPGRKDAGPSPEHAPSEHTATVLGKRKTCSRV